MKTLFALAATVLLALGATVTGRAAEEDLGKQPTCKYCGMDREKFAHSRVYLEYDDGSAVGTCSVHCAALELATSLDRAPKTIWVGDYRTKKLINAEKATWVIGGGKAGVMTRRAKWAFENPSEAEAFVKENGGKTAAFEDSLRSAFEDLYDDVKMIRQRRAERRMKMMERQP